MGNTQSSIRKVNYEDIQYSIINSSNYILLNTLPSTYQTCLILNTLSIDDEVNYIDNLISKIKNDKFIIIYGLNSNDDSVIKKYHQLLGLHFINVFVYTGGLFEWLLLQDIYGEDEFPTTNKEIDILKFKPIKVLNTQFLEY
jgi:hypothetical protein